MNKKPLFLLFIFIAIQSAFSAVTRGPYLQLSTTSSIIIRWRTDVATDSRVQYGTTQGSLTESVDDFTPTTEHEVKLTGLTPGTKYFYSVGTTSGVVLSGNDSKHFFLTNPTTGTAKDTRIWVIGDFGFGNSAQAQVRDRYYTYTGNTPTDVWLMLGDNAYDKGFDTEFQTNVFNVYSNLFKNSVAWPTIGNHDTGLEDVVTTDAFTARNPSPTIPYYLNFNLPKNAEAGGLASGTEDYYSFNYGNIHFICLDSWTESLSQTGPMITWLKNDLAANNAKWTIAYWHHPPYTMGSKDSDQVYETRQAFVKHLEDNGVDMVLTGHSHSYERSFFIDGHYGMSSTFDPTVHVKVPGSGRVDGTGAYTKGPGPHNGTVYAVVGSSGDVTSGTLNHPANYIGLAVLGSMVIDISGNTLNAKMITNTGAIGDYFTIIKGASGPQVLTSITVTPTPASISPGSTQQFTAVAKDQSGIPMTTQPAFTWTFGGSAANGSINSSGLFTAGSAEGGPFTVTASSGGKSGTAQITVASSVTVVFQDGVAGYGGTVDTTIDQFNSIDPQGTKVRMNVDYSAGVENRQSLLKFDLSSIPTNAVVASASVTLFVTRTNGNAAAETLLLGKVTSGWQEGILWNDGVPTSVPSGVTMPGVQTSGPTNAYVIAGLKDVVQSWTAEPTKNFGLIITTLSKLNYGFATREIATTSYRPKIQITYSVGSTTNPDSDGDGLPDAWETDNFGSLGQTGTGDADGDGINNAAEHSAGTSPVNRSSRLAITSEQVTGPSQFSVTWQSVAGKSYVIETSSNCVDWSVAGGLDASASTSTWTDLSASSSRKFYRIKLP